MFKAFTQFFTEYAKGTPPGRMLIHVFAFLLLFSWVAFAGLVALNFPTIVDIYDRYQAQRDVAVERALVNETQVNRIISEQRVSLGVDRLYVSRFHNGRVDVNGIHFIFFSRVSESTGGGVSNEIIRTQNLPLSIFPQMLEPLSRGECYYVEQVDDTVENNTFLGEMGINSTMVCPIHGPDGRLIGIIGADGVLDQINSQEAVGLEAGMTTLASVMGSLLSAPQ